MRHYRNSRRRATVALAAVIAAASRWRVRAAAGRPPVPRVMVATFASADKELGLKAAEELRNRITRDVDARKLLRHSQGRHQQDARSVGLFDHRSASAERRKGARRAAPRRRVHRRRRHQDPDRREGRRTPDPLSRPDARTAAPQCRSREGRSGSRCNLEVVSGRPASSSTARRTATRCSAKASTMKPMLAARSALVEYPNGTIAAVCLAQRIQGTEAERFGARGRGAHHRGRSAQHSSASIRSAEIYQANKDPKALQVLTRLMAADPSNEHCGSRSSSSLVRSGRPAWPFRSSRKPCAQNPGDPKTLNSRGALPRREPGRQSACYRRRDDQGRHRPLPTQRISFAAAAAAAVATNPTRAAADRCAGNRKIPEQRDAARCSGEHVEQGRAERRRRSRRSIRALAVNPKVENGYAQKALILSAHEHARQRSRYHQTAQCSRSRQEDAFAGCAQDRAATRTRREMLRRTAQIFSARCSFLKLADQLEPSADAKFLVGRIGVPHRTERGQRSTGYEELHARAPGEGIISDRAGQRSGGTSDLCRCGEAASDRDSAVHAGSGRSGQALLQMIRGAPGAWDSAYHAPVLVDEIVELFERFEERFSIALWGAADTAPPFLLLGAHVTAIDRDPDAVTQAHEPACAV